MYSFPSIRSSWPENAPASVADIYNFDPSFLPLEEHKPILGHPSGQIDEQEGFHNLLDMDFFKGFGILNDDYSQVHDEPSVATPVDSEKVPNGEGIVLSCHVDPCNKKLSHNAHERNRQRKQNALYAQLQALLPNPNGKRKLSIPKTVCRALKYILELRSEIAKLCRQRDKLLIIRRISESSKSKANREHLHSHDGFKCFPPNVTVNSAALTHSEVLVTVYTCRAALLESFLLVLIEKEGLEVMDASTLVSLDTICCILRLKMVKSTVDMEVLQKKILLLCGNNSGMINCHQMQHRLVGRHIN
ncbi:hypothetical protein SUGI_1074850 [Cryptomeria japonica]|uniref:protein IRON-RELATED TRANSCRIPTION FACTOR 2-like n=1 Tax=Cryptomeria japonica TaxID=3369 RepID=UPI002414A3DC|nr:protein IRON-RELATED TRANSCRIPTION FACTOR 2-like [Cryptomeria japonica]GLJ50445.1 hypothetical protein SUGI_1074850 [Cryptomeria japonica]